ncbi:MAG: HAD family hydrolase [Enterococcus sp.]
MIKAIFFDIDGTLLTSQGTVSKKTKEVIQRAQEKGILVGVATGRGPVDIHRLLDDLPLDMYITYNGQLVFSQGKIIYARKFEPTILKKIVQYSDDNNRQVMFGGVNQVAGSRIIRLSQSISGKKLLRFVPKRFPVRMMKKTLQKLSAYQSDDYYGQMAILREPIYQCVLLSPVTEAPKLRQALPECDFQRSNPYTVDIVPKGGSKLNGIYAFLNYHGIDPKEAIAFGDHLNDVEMISGVGIGVAMGNGQVEAKAAADYVTASNNQEGIPQALKVLEIIC